VTEQNVDSVTNTVRHGTLWVILGAVDTGTALPVHPAEKVPVIY
jgi:hypothetical protein